MIIKLFIDMEWNKEETDYLFDLVREYDSRWYIVHDRYDYPYGVPRTMEVCATLLCASISHYFTGHPGLEGSILQCL
jgi:hypothetical protein